jgi:SpoVK/Ycf46/Vps4 family AAA+-type ATPase
VALSPSVDFDQLARDTEGYSGADLQALVYNAQLEVIHETISTTSVSGRENKREEDERPIEYTIIGSTPGEKTVKSTAEEAAFQRRVSFYYGQLRVKSLRTVAYHGLQRLPMGFSSSCTLTGPRAITCVAGRPGR